MFLFGCGNLNVFKHNILKYFVVEYDSLAQHVRIRDKITKSCAANVRLPLETDDDVLTSLYIQIFKYDCAFHLRHDEDDFKLFQDVHKSLGAYYTNVIQPRDEVYTHLEKVSTELAVEHANNVCFQRKATPSFRNRVEMLSARHSSLNTYSIQQNKFLHT